MKKSKAPLIPITKKTLIPPGTVMGQSPTIAQLQAEAQGRLRRIVSDQSRVAEIVDILVNEVLEREGRLQALTPKEPG